MADNPLFRKYDGPANPALSECDQADKDPAKVIGSHLKYNYEGIGHKRNGSEDVIDTLRNIASTAAEANRALEIIANHPEFMEYLELQDLLGKLKIG
jgi:hypothetical protein